MKDWQPTAKVETLRRRAKLIAEIRTFFTANNYWEVETPLASSETVVDAHIEPFELPVDKSPLFLQTSPEAGMKRLLAAGADRIFQITRAFRSGEAGRRHNPEYTILEWYAVGEDHFQQMEFTERLVRFVFQKTDHPLPESSFPRWTYDWAFEEAIGQKVITCGIEELQKIASAHAIEIPIGMQDSPIDDWRNLLLSHLVEPALEQQPAVFLYDYPASQAALAKVRRESPAVAERFELYLSGVEICNGYHELTGADELRRRADEQNAIRVAAGGRKLPAPSRLLSAMDAGLPDCSGVAVGVDRLIMQVLGLASIADVTAFPIDRA